MQTRTKRPAPPPVVEEHTQHALASIRIDAVEMAIMDPSKWVCTECETTMCLWLCLSCGCFVCHDIFASTPDDDSNTHLSHHALSAEHALFMELNDTAHAVYCFDTTSTLPSHVDNCRGDIYQARRLLSQAQDLEDATRLTRRAASPSPTSKWRKVNIVHGFTFHAAYLSKQAAARRKRDDLLYTAAFKWRHLVLFKCFSSWKDEWTIKVQATMTPSRRRRWNALTPGKTGLRNLGNTCYMNATLQSLSHVFLFKSALMAAAGVGPPGTLLREVKHVVERLWSGKYAAFSPDGMLSALWQTFPTLAGFKQQDCDELLRHILDSIRSDPSIVDQTTKKSFVDQLFQGEVVRKIVCQGCKTESVTTEAFLGVLSVEVPKAQRVHAIGRRHVPTSHCSLDDCFLNTFATESLQGESQYFCSTCQDKRDAVQLAQLGPCPPVLIVHINRSDWTDDGEPKKIQTHVAFPDRGLDLSAHMPTPPTTRLVYDLNAVIVHEGRTLTQGHYTAYAYSATGAAWHHFNDHRVHQCTWTEVAAVQAYMLVYTQRQTDG